MNTKLENSPTALMLDEAIASLQQAREQWVRGGYASATKEHIQLTKALLGGIEQRLDAHMGD